MSLRTQLTLIRALAGELCSSQRAARVPEPRKIMDDPVQIAAYTRAALHDKVMTPVYLFHAIQASQVIPPKGRVLDLGCGPAIQLTTIAQLFPEVEFVGVDLSENMLAWAEQHAASLGLTNVSFVKADMTRLECIESASIDAVISTVALHHLPDAECLDRTFGEIARVLKPDGGVYLADFAHLRSDAAIRHFGQQYADRQAAIFTQDYHDSLRAAFTLDQVIGCAAKLSGKARVFRMWPLGLMVAVKSSERALPKGVRRQLADLLAALPPEHRGDFVAIRKLFRFGGLKTPSLTEGGIPSLVGASLYHCVPRTGEPTQPDSKGVSARLQPDP